MTSEVRGVFCPDVVVVQCGADSLSGDPIGTFNLTLEGVGACLEHVIGWDLPTLLLGGGGGARSCGHHVSVT